MIGIYCFSGTGNTLKCAKAPEASLKELGAEVSFCEIADGSEMPTEHGLVICYPVYGLNMPRIMKSFCRAMPDGANVWFLKTSGKPLRLQLLL